jgi:hypothetical protein
MPPPPPQQQGNTGISAIFRNATSTLLEAGEPRVCRWGLGSKGVLGAMMALNKPASAAVLCYTLLVLATS